MPARLVSIVRYPVKGLSPEPLTSVRVTPGDPLPFDRAFAIENGASGFDPAAPATLAKIRYFMLMKNERLATLSTRFDDATHVLSLTAPDGRQASGDLTTPGGRAAVEAFIDDVMADQARGPAKVLASPGFSFSDVADRVVHLINLASVRALEPFVGKPVDPGRFRANLVVDGLEPFAELDWVGAPVRIGEARFVVTKRTERCAATNVDPQTGARDLTIPRTLMGVFGHTDFGIYMRVTQGGLITAGDPLVAGAPSEASQMPF